jgi:lysophospholipase L1-like esterase
MFMETHSIRIAVVFLFLIAPIHSFAAASEKILMLGDSITKGVRTGVADNETFSALVERQLRDSKIDAHVVNAGVGGERTDQALARIDALLSEHKPSVVVVMYGTNDSYVDVGKTTSRLTAREYHRNLFQLAEKITASGAKPILMTPPRWGVMAASGSGENPNRELAAFVEACRELAEEHELPLVDHFKTWTESEAKGQDLGQWTTDQCHPNSEGHRKLAEAILSVLRDVIAKQ